MGSNTMRAGATAQRSIADGLTALPERSVAARSARFRTMTVPIGARLGAVPRLGGLYLARRDQGRHASSRALVYSRVRA